MSLLHLPAPRSYIGQVASKCYVPTQAGTASWASRSSHYARDYIGQVSVAWGNWRCQIGGIESNGSATATMKASIEYPIGGARHQLLWNGATSVSITAGSTLFTDFAHVGIPAGAKFYIHRSWTGTGVVMYSDSSDGPTGTSGDDRLENTATDLTMSGTAADSFPGLYCFPLAIVARTTKPSVFLIGDSRCAGLLDTTTDTYDDRGQLAKAIGPQLAYINTGNSGQYASAFVTDSTRRVPLAKWCSHTLCMLGINDIDIGGGPASTLETNLASIRGLISPRPMFIGTINPITSGSWNNADGSDQTADGFTERVTHNTWVRAGQPWFTPLEIADFLEISRNGNKWKAPGYTTDGTHETTFANQQVVINQAIFSRIGIGNLKQSLR